MVDRTVISSFAKATMETFQDMCQIEARPRRAKTDDERDPGEGVHALIALEGALEGTIGLSIPNATALAAVTAMTAQVVHEVDGLVADGVQELVNIIVGRAKKHLEAVRLSFAFGLPKTLVGRQFPTPDNTDYRNLAIIFSAAPGEFLLNLTWRMRRAA